MRYIIAVLLTSTAALAEVPRVVTDIPPVHSLVAAVMEGVGTPGLLLEAGASAHDFQMRPSQAAALAAADLVIWVGPELTPWLEGALEARPEGAAVLGLLGAEGVYLREYGGDDHGAEGEDHAHDAAEEGHDHTHEGIDPHAWLDPENAIRWVDLIATELALLDPENAPVYAANTTRAAAAIRAADDAARAALAGAKDRPFVAFHDAYGYFTGHYGLTLAGTIAEGDAAAPGAAHLSELMEKMAGTGAPCIFPEAQHDPAHVEQIAAATGARIGGALDPEGRMLEPGPALYPALITGLAETLAGCLAE